MPRRGKVIGHVLLHALMLRNVGKIDGRLEHGRVGGIFSANSFDPKRERWQSEFFVVQLDEAADRLAGKNMLGQFQSHFDAGKSDRRENAGHQE